MAAELTIFDDAGATTSRHITFTNTIGDPLLAAVILVPEARSCGNAFADDYTLDLVFTDPLWQFTVTPANGPVRILEFDPEAGPDLGLVIPGIQLTFDTLNPLIIYQAIIVVGYHAGTVVAGSTSAGKQLFVKNTGDTDGLDARIQIRPDASFTNDEPIVLIGLDDASLLPTTLPGVWTFEVSGSLGAFEVIVELNGEPVGTYPVSDPGGSLQPPDGPLVFFEILEYAWGGIGTVIVSEAYTRVRLAPDVADSPGEWSASDLVIGGMDVDETVPFWVRVETASEDSPADNPNQAQLQARITSV